MQRFSAYRIMWLFVMFDLPTLTRDDQKRANTFRGNLVKDGFTRFQYSVYIRHCISVENMEAHKRRVKKYVPDEGLVCAIPITDKQFSQIEIFIGKRQTPAPEPPHQLELF